MRVDERIKNNEKSIAAAVEVQTKSVRMHMDLQGHTGLQGETVTKDQFVSGLSIDGLCEEDEETRCV